MNHCLLKSRAVDFFEPNKLFLLLQLWKLKSKNIPRNRLLCLFVNLDLLLKEVVVDEANSAKVALQSLLLSFVWIESEFVCSVHLHTNLFT